MAATAHLGCFVLREKCFNLLQFRWTYERKFEAVDNNTMV